uniref:Protein KRI1 homolog n=1 Tax=Syphacia muris TaxID=451379 RepID=A0A0N5ASF9_9BILA
MIIFFKLICIFLLQKGLKEIWHDDKKLNSEEKFLRDFLLERKYEIDSNPSTPYEDLGVITDDEEMEREQEFEHKFNFRFEEPDKDFIKQYPRTVSESLRKDDGKRKEKRLMRKQRKCAEKQAKKNEIRELKALKKKEIEAKLEKLKKLAGDELNVNIEDVEGDFDPVAYDRRMAELFNKEYYENADENEDKPSFSDDSDVSDEENVNLDFSNEQENKNDASESKVNHSAKGNGESSKGPTTRRKKRNAKFWNAVAKEKPLFDPNEKTFEEYYNEYYALDYEDILGDTITRFKYRNVPANSFGLTNEEILKLDDKQLNAWASLKKVTAYRTDREEKYDIMAYAKKALDEEKKKRILNANYNKRKKRKHDNGVAGVDDNRLLAYGVNPKKIRNKIKYGSSKVEKK